MRAAGEHRHRRGSYRNGTIILVAPEFGPTARELGEALRTSVRVALAESESIAADHVTASVAAVTGLVKAEHERVHLLTQAIRRADAAGAGGNRVPCSTRRVLFAFVLLPRKG